MAAFELYLRQQGLAARTVRQILNRLDTILNTCSPLTEENFGAFEVALLDKYSPSSVLLLIVRQLRKLGFTNIEIKDGRVTADLPRSAPRKPKTSWLK